MADTRSRREKLRAMAEQSVSPHEAAIARAKLAALSERAEEPARSSDDIVDELRRAYESIFGRGWAADGGYEYRPDRTRQSRVFHDFKPSSGRRCGSCGLERNVGYHRAASGATDTE